jgi:hypothetical protein
MRLLSQLALSVFSGSLGLVAGGITGAGAGTFFVGLTAFFDLHWVLGVPAAIGALAACIGMVRQSWQYTSSERTS